MVHVLLHSRQITFAHYSRARSIRGARSNQGNTVYLFVSYANTMLKAITQSRSLHYNKLASALRTRSWHVIINHCGLGGRTIATKMLSGETSG